MAGSQSKRNRELRTFADFQQHVKARSQTMYTMIDQLKGLNVEKQTLDALVELSAGAKLLTSEYASFGLPEPEWLSDAKRTLVVEIKRQATDRIAMELRQLDAEDEKLMSANEKRARNADRRAELQRKLQEQGQPVGA